MSKSFHGDSCPSTDTERIAQHQASIEALKGYQGGYESKKEANRSIELHKKEIRKLMGSNKK